MTQVTEAPQGVLSRYAERVGQRRLLAVVVVAILAVEVPLGDASVALAPRGTDVAALWPNSGLSVIALLLTARRWRPLVLAGIAVATVLGNLLGERTLEVSAGFAVANVTEAALAVWLLTQATDPDPVGRAAGHGGSGADGADGAAWDPRVRLDTVEDFFRLFVACGVASALGALLAGSTIGLLVGGDPLVAGRLVLGSHLAAMLLLVPLALRLPRDPEPTATAVEVATQWLVLAAVLVAIFSGAATLPIVFILYPLLVWGALRSQPSVTVLQVVASGVVVAVLTLLDIGPYVDTVEMTDQPPELIGTLLQAHLLASVLVTLPLALMKVQRLQVLEDLTRSHEELDAILAATTATAIVGVGTNGRVEYVNVGAERLTGHPGPDLVGRANVVLVDPTAAVDATGNPLLAMQVGPVPETFVLRELVDARLEAAGGTFVQDWDFQRPDGTVITASVAMSRRVDASGAPAGYLAVAEDVTERRRRERATEQELASEKQVVDRLAQLDQTKNDFLATVSHELRTPITSILGYSQLLLGQEDADLPAIQRQIVGRIERNGRRLMGLIEDMLTMSQIEVGSFGVRRDPVDVREPLALAVESTLPLLPARDLELHQDVPDRPVMVAGDADKLERAFANLLSNAVKFSNVGDEVAVRLTTSGGEAVLSVTDTGIGIDARDREQLFERFFRGAQAHHQAIQGAGLGLPIAATIVTGHEGRIDIESAPGQGSTFTIRLPLLPD